MVVNREGREGGGGYAEGQTGVTVEACEGETVTGYSICFYLPVR